MSKFNTVKANLGAAAITVVEPAFDAVDSVATKARRNFKETRRSIREAQAEKATRKEAEKAAKAQAEALVVDLLANAPK